MSTETDRLGPERGRDPVSPAQDRGRFFQASALVGALLTAVGSALVCGVLLLVNGSLVYVVLDSLGPSGANRVVNEGVVQFLLFTAPVALLVIEWLLWDLAVRILLRAWVETD